MKVLLSILLMVSIIALTGCSSAQNNTDRESTAPSVESQTDSANTKDNHESTAAPNNPSQSQHLPYDGSYPQHEAYGTGVGAMPGRVVWYHDSDSVNWDGSGYWWEPGHFDEAVILKMVNDSIASLGGKDTAKDGWNALFIASKQSRSMSGGYARGEKIAIKANVNGSAVFDDDTSGKTQMSYTNPVLLKALLTSLVKEGEVDPSDITVYDVSRLFPDYMVEMCTEGALDGIRFVGRNNGEADENSY